MSSENFITIISAVLGSGVVVALLQFLQTRRKNRAEGDVAVATTQSQVALVGVQELEAKLNYLSKVIEVLEKENLRLEKQNLRLDSDINEEQLRNTKLADRMRTLEVTCDKYEVVIRKLCIELGYDFETYLTK